MDAYQRMRRSIAFSSRYHRSSTDTVQRLSAILSHLIGANVHLSVSNRRSLNGTEARQRTGRALGTYGTSRWLGGSLVRLDLARLLGRLGPRGRVRPQRQRGR